MTILFQSVLAVLLKVDLCVAVGVSKSCLEVDGALAVDRADDVALGREIVPVGKVGSTSGLVGRLKLLGCLSIAALDDKGALRSLALGPADAAVLGVCREILENEKLLDLGGVVVGLDVEARRLLRDVGSAGEDVVESRGLEASFSSGGALCGAGYNSGRSAGDGQEGSQSSKSVDEGRHFDE
ncbi:hypothetical protein HG531_001246 [Fusarium graminearum]|nr:hypothetical protein HG531_001246 [Fusarium graminearum]